MSRGRLTIGLGDIITFSEKERLIIIKKWCWIARGEREEEGRSKGGGCAVVGGLLGGGRAVVVRW